MNRYPIFLLVGFNLFSSLHFGAEIRFKVRHDHGVKSCHGELVFGDTSVEYITNHQKDARAWKFEDIQQLGLLGPKKISLLTYEDRKLEFGKDKIFNFELTEGVIPESLGAFLHRKLAKPLVSELIPTDIKTIYEIPVKHQHTFGGCQGTLEISDRYIAYKTSQKAHSRLWSYGDLSSMGSTGSFQLRLSTFERTGGENGSEKNYIFDLKRRLDQKTYDFIWWKINGPQIASGSNHRPD
ncbi:MAG TPA: hypothetical protein VMW38_06350 [Terriglobia bacterium]|nr:hypothetical protein [Terriglobia bacterium]